MCGHFRFTSTLLFILLFLCWLESLDTHLALYHLVSKLKARFCSYKNNLGKLLPKSVFLNILVKKLVVDLQKFYLFSCFLCWFLSHQHKGCLNLKLSLMKKRIVLWKKKTLEVTIVVYCCYVLEGVDVVFILNFSSSYVLTSIKINRSKKVVRQNWKLFVRRLANITFSRLDNHFSLKQGTLSCGTSEVKHHLLSLKKKRVEKGYKTLCFPSQ